MKKHFEKTIGTAVQEFYNRTPFPDYELNRFHSITDLREAAWPFAKLLDYVIPREATVVDVGCGTGQLSALLSLRRPKVLGLDFSDSSLSKAAQLKEKLRLKTLELRKIDILDKSQIDTVREKSDFLLCLGVLHHTGDAYSGFKNILSLLKPGGGLPSVFIINTAVPPHDGSRLVE